MNNELLQLVIYTAAGFFIGLIIYKLIMPLFSRLAARTAIRSDDLVVDTIRRWVIPWFVALGLFLGLQRIEMDGTITTGYKMGLSFFTFFRLR